MFVTSHELLAAAQAGGYAVGAFNVENLEMVQAVIAAAEEAHAPVLLQTTPSTLRYIEPALFGAAVRAAAERAAVPVVLHLDHGSSPALAAQAVRAGYTSIMIDGSRLPYEENIATVREVVGFCHPNGLPVEAELGCVGGKEDDLVAGTDSPYTDPDAAADFVARTGVDSLAVAIGTAHGIYHGEPHLDLDRLAAIRRTVSVPLVLHGTSGVPDATVTACIARGICKVNYATDLRLAYSAGVKRVLTETPDTFDPKTYGKAGRESVKAFVLDRIRLLGCQGKA